MKYKEENLLMTINFLIIVVISLLIILGYTFYRFMICKGI
jgi:hypothetical protein